MGLAAKYDFKVRVIMVAIVSLMYITCCEFCSVKCNTKSLSV